MIFGGKNHHKVTSFFSGHPAEGEEPSRAGSEAAQEEERVRVEIVEQMLSLTATANQEPGKERERERESERKQLY